MKTARADAADIVDEGAIYPESAYTFTPQLVNVSKIGHYVPVTGEIREDEPGTMARINNRLLSAIMLRSEDLILSRNATNPADWDGILNQTGLPSVDASSESVLSALSMGIEQVEVSNEDEVMVNVVLMHPRDFWAYSRDQLSTGAYLLGSATEAVIRRAWGVRVVTSTALTQGTALVGSTQMSHIRDRRDVNIQMAQQFAVVGTGGDRRTAPSDTIVVWGDVRFAFIVERVITWCRINNIS